MGSPKGHTKSCQMKISYLMVASFHYNTGFREPSPSEAKRSGSSYMPVLEGFHRILPQDQSMLLKTAFLDNNIKSASKCHASRHAGAQRGYAAGATTESPAGVGGWQSNRTPGFIGSLNV